MFFKICTDDIAVGGAKSTLGTRAHQDENFTNKGKTKSQIRTLPRGGSSKLV